MAGQAIADDYASTVKPEVYVSGIMVHVWLAAMYEIMKQRTVEEIRRRLDTYPNREVLVYDLGCGPGHFTLALAQAVEAELKDSALKVSIIGIDKSDEFIQYAHRKHYDLHPRAQRLVRFMRADVLDTELQAADIITASGFIHHFSPDERGVLLDRIASLLVEGGILIEGDEHPAPDGNFERSFPLRGRRLAICFLYFQVIAGARAVGHMDLEEAEIENCIAELYRDAPDALPACSRETFMKDFGRYAELLMPRIAEWGLESGCQLILRLFDRELPLHATENESLPKYSPLDRGDFKLSLKDFVWELEEHGLVWKATYHTGNKLLGDAPVSIFQLQKA